jgi:hypothetical protein
VSGEYEDILERFGFEKTSVYGQLNWEHIKPGL